ncbi:MAG: hypothetical protein RR326_09985, partial [Stenotrophomonas sp.]
MSMLATLILGLSASLMGTAVQADELLAFVERRSGTEPAAVAALAPRAQTQVVALTPEPRPSAPAPRAQTQVVSFVPEPRPSTPAPRAQTQVVSLEPETRKPAPAPRAAQATVAFERAPATV